MRNICPVCGVTYEAETRRRRYCSERCRKVAAWRKQRILDACPDIPLSAFDLADSASRLRHVANELDALAASADPAAAAVAARMAAGIHGLLDAEGL